MRHARITLAAVVLGLGLSSDAVAQSAVRPTIHHVTLDAGAGVLTITGEGFGREPVVTVDGQAVAVLSGGSATRLDVLAPAAILVTPGSYRLTVFDPARQVGDVFVVATQAGSGNAPGTAAVVEEPAAPPETVDPPTVGAVSASERPPAGGFAPMAVIEDPGSPWRTALGYQALIFNTTGFFNTASGYRALTNNTTGDSNTAGGFLALETNTAGGNNTASGAGALSANTLGSDNTASGAHALVHNSTGNYNTASGSSALANNTSGSHNVASGSVALSANTTGAANTASGMYALAANTTAGATRRSATTPG